MTNPIGGKIQMDGSLMKWNFSSATWATLKECFAMNCWWSKTFVFSSCKSYSPKYLSKRFFGIHYCSSLSFNMTRLMHGSFHKNNYEMNVIKMLASLLDQMLSKMWGEKSLRSLQTVTWDNFYGAGKIKPYLVDATPTIVIFDVRCKPPSLGKINIDIPAT